MKSSFYGGFYMTGITNLEEALSRLASNDREAIKFILKSAWDRINTHREEVTKQIEAVMQVPGLQRYKAEYAECLLVLAKYHLEDDSMLQAKPMLDSALNIFTEESNAVGLARTHRMYSHYYSKTGSLEQSLVSCFAGLDLIRDNHLQVLENGYPIEFPFLNNIASIYDYTGRYHDALEFFIKAYEYVKDTGCDYLVLVLCNISENYVKTNKPLIALKYCDDGLAAARKNNLGPKVFSFCYHCYGLIHKQLGDINKALECFHEAVLYAEKSKARNYQVDSLIELGKLYLDIDKLIVSRNYLEQALEIAEIIEANVWMINLHYILAENFERSGNHSKALYHYRKHMQLYKDIISKDLQQKVENYNVELKVQNAQKDAEIFRLKNFELKAKNEEIEQKAQELTESYRGLTVISEIGQKITATLDIEEALGTIYENIGTLMKVNVMGVGLFDESTGIINYKMFIEEGARIPEFQSNINNETTFASICIQTRKEVFINDIAGVPVIYHNHDKINKTPRSIIYYPLILKGKVLGIFTVQSYESGAYSDRNLEAVKALASYMAIAINNSQKSKTLHDMIHELEILSTRDSLTGLYNRRYIHGKILEECSKSLSEGGKSSILLIDIDHFKAINDTYGHGCGDFVLREISSILVAAIRRNDYASRWGGEEFLVLLTDIDEKMAAIIAERLRISVQNHVFSYNNKTMRASITIGITEVNIDPSIEDIIKRADQALYLGKQSGRNRVQVSSGF